MGLNSGSVSAAEMPLLVGGHVPRAAALASPYSLASTSENST
jgi:hypothetical protein